VQSLCYQTFSTGESLPPEIVLSVLLLAKQGGAAFQICIYSSELVEFCTPSSLVVNYYHGFL